MSSAPTDKSDTFLPKPMGSNSFTYLHGDHHESASYMYYCACCDSFENRIHFIQHNESLRLVRRYRGDLKWVDAWRKPRIANPHNFFEQDPAGIAMVNEHEKSCALYRHFDKDNRLLYVGITFSAATRTRQHRDKSNWFEDVVTVKIERYPSRRMARDAERAAIRDEKPIYNRQS